MGRILFGHPVIDGCGYKTSNARETRSGWMDGRTDRQMNGMGIDLIESSSWTRSRGSITSTITIIIIILANAHPRNAHD